MHEKFQEEMERQERRLDDQIFQPPVVRCLGDIKRLLVELDPGRTFAQTVPISSEMTAEDEQGHVVTYKVSAAADTQNKRSIILKGFEFIKSRVDLEERAKRDVQPVMVNGKAMMPAIKPTLTARAWVDPLLERWFNATREGLRICWTVQEGKFVYDVFEHKLFRAKPAEAAATSTNGS